MELKNIAVIGPNGNVGKAIIERLRTDNRFHLTCVIRPTSQYLAPSPSDISIAIADFENQASISNALNGQDAVVCCVPGGATHFAPQKLLIDASIDAGVKFFFASEYISDILSPHFAIFPIQFVGDKVGVRRYLEEKAAAGEIAWTALNGGPFFDMWLTRGHAGFDIANRKARIYGTGNNPACWTPLPIIADAAVNMLRNPDATKNRSIFVCGVKDVTQNALLDALEAETGEKFEVQRIDLGPIKAKALEDLEKGDYRAANMGLAINSNFNEDDSAANFWHKVENDLVGVKAVSVREAVKTTLLAARNV